jgi:hypothetical protein
VTVAVLACAAMAVARSRGARLASAAIALVALTGWLLVHVRVLTQSVVVSAWPAVVVRASVAVAIGFAGAGIVVVALEGRRSLDEYASRPPSQRRPRRGRRAPATS